METVFAQLKRHLGFGPEEEAVLRALHPLAVSDFESIALGFYERIAEEARAQNSPLSGERRLEAWMDEMLRGPWDEDYFDLRRSIRVVHLRIALPPHYVFGAINHLRGALQTVVDREWGGSPELHRRGRNAVNKVLDLELAIMLHTYRDDLLTEQGRRDRLTTLGKMVGSIGDDLRNPLGVIETSLFILSKSVDIKDGRVRKHLRRIDEQLRLTNAIVTSLIDLIREQPPVREWVQLEPIVRLVIVAMVAPPEVAVRSDGFAALPAVWADPLQIRQMLLHLVENAVHAVAPQGEVLVSAAVVAEDVEIVVADDGPGVSPEVRNRLFEPMVTTKPKGIGMGLPSVRRIVERHGGTVAYQPKEQGARFVVRLPIAPQA